ncbi:MAG: polysaccharide export protein EpsE [Zoogloeaceae bacterium]|nr:polysaccharide export protein EpsE [Zoogloeaceae bacterium]
MLKAIYRGLSVLALLFCVSPLGAQDHQHQGGATGAGEDALSGLLLQVESQDNGVAFASESAAQPEFNYTLGAGDVIRILVFQNPELTLDTRVSESGSITYPLVGVVQIGGLTLEAAEQRIAQALSDGGFVKHPQVNIVLARVQGSQVSVLGQVNRPGRYPLETANLKVSDLLATAGGITPVGSDVVILTGVRERLPFRKEINLPTAYVEGVQSEDVAIAAGDILYVHRAPMFYIYGEVQRPGSYRIERGMTVQQALAQGGGITPRGSEYWLRLHRKNAEGVVERLSPDWFDPVLPDDVIYVRESIF